MRVLLVEDEARSEKAAIESLDREIPDAILRVARSRDEAIEAIEAGSFDLVLCDIRLPPHGDSADVQEAHGLAVHAACRTVCPGTPIIFLTGFATSRATRSELTQGGLATILGIERHPLVDLVDKDDPVALENRLSALGAAFTRLQAVTISGVVPADETFSRAVGLYALSINQSRAEVILAPGLSGATVGRVRLTGAGETPAAIFMKTTSKERAEDEYRRYRQQVSNRLAPGMFAPTHEPFSGSLGGAAAIVSTLADGTRSLFDVLRSSPESGPGIVERLREGLRPWTASPRGTEATTLAALRRLRLADADLRLSSAASAFAAAGVEEKEVQIRQMICHGDLHGENVLVDRDGRPVLIDFGDSGPAAASTDPVTLELSLLFHRDGPARDDGDLGGLDWSVWPDIDAFVCGSPFEPFIRATRRWAYDISNEVEIMSFAYAHAMRQLKYDDVDSNVALQIAAAAARVLDV